MMKIELQKSTERVSLNLALRYWRDRLVERMRVTNMIILCTRTSTLTKQLLKMP